MSVPILPGFHPDPSICRVGEDYFLVTSTFEYFPGVPIFHSDDLVTWRQLGNVLDRPSQLPLGPGAGGIFAPTLRHHDGRFWLITTDIGRVRDGHLIVSAVDPAGPWSDPVFTTGVVGIDPDLAWDDDGTCRLTWTQRTPTGTQITQARVDPVTGELQSEPTALWSGTGLAHPEGPHVFRRGAWWYLVIAEGGTERGHAVSVARSRSIDGPFEGNPANPILSHRSTDHSVQSTGHADLVETPAGDWAMVYLGVRSRGATPGFHVNGRETFLAGIEWIDDWPVVHEERYDVPVAVTDFTDSFSGPALDPRWISPGGPGAAFSELGEDGGLSLQAPGDLPAGLVAVRTRDGHWQADAVIAAGDVSLVLRIDDAHTVTVEALHDRINARATIGGLAIPLGSTERAPGDVILRIRATPPEDESGFRNGPDVLHLGLVENDTFTELGSIDGRYTSTEVAGGFTGRVVGVAAGERGGTLIRFDYRGLDPLQG